MAIQNTRYTPKRRGPALGDAAGGTSERIAKRERDRVLRVPGHRTEDIRLTPLGTDVTTGDDPALYDVGNVDRLSVGRYRLTRQTAASGTAEPLSDYAYLDFDIYEETAGVFLAVTSPIFSTEGGTATSDDDDTDVLGVDATMVAVADAALDGADSDSRVTVFVATSADVTDAAAWTVEAKVLVEGNLYVMDAEEADDHVFTLQRLT
jgi:hypothetical protein